MYLGSRDIAEVLGKRHDNLLRAIRKYCEALGEDAPKCFVPDGEGRRQSYKVTYEGCELLAGRMIGKEGDEFRSWYRAGLKPTTEPVAEAPTETEPEVKEYTVAEAGELLGMSERSVYRNIQSGKLEAVDREILIPTVRKYITQDALDKFKAGREV